MQTKRLELLDQQGRIRAVLSCEDDTGIPSCTFIDAAGETRLIVGLSWNDVPSIQLCAPDGTARVALVVRPEGMGMMILADDQKQTKTLTPGS
ncbi:MAG: hypothetical protein EXR93_05070 [Gemmatimonadetes bacterium]|nr:hypothetical protein [Gemmatimonadota bacterium]